MLKELVLGIGNFLKAPRFLFKHKLGWALLVPIFLNILFMSLGWGATSELTDLVATPINEYVESLLGSEANKGWILETIEWFFWILLKLAFFLLYAYVGGFLVLILMSPLLAYLSERTEEIIDGTTYPFNFSQFVKDILRGVVVAIRSLVYELLLTIAILVLTFVPGVNLAVPVLLFTVTAYFYGYSFLDYNLERRRLNSKESTSYVLQHKGMAVGVGLPYAVLLIVPVIGPSLAGFSAIFGTIAATVTWKNTERAKT
jgi:CysZ protein